MDNETRNVDVPIIGEIDIFALLLFTLAIYTVISHGKEWIAVVFIIAGVIKQWLWKQDEE